MRRLIPLVSALCFIGAWAASSAASDHVRFMGRDFPRAGSPAFRAERARLAALGALGADAARTRADLARNPGAPRDGADATNAWVGGGIPVTNTSFVAQFSVSAIPDGTSGVLMAWMDTRHGNLDIFSTRLTSNGDLSPGWPAAGFALSIDDSNQFSPDVESDGANGAFVAFGDIGVGGYGNVYLQHVTATGSVASGFPQNGLVVVPPGAPGFGLIDGGSSAYVSWLDATSQIRLVLITGAGAVAPGWTSAGLAIGPENPSGWPDVSAVRDGAGGGYIGWVQTDSVMITRVTSSGGFASGWSAAGLMLVDGTASGADLQLALLSNGDAMVFWSDYRNGFDTDLYAMRVTAAGGLGPSWPANGAPLCTKGGDQSLLGAVGDASGGAIGIFDTDATGLFAERIDSGGGIASGWPGTGLQLCAPISGKSSGRPVADGADGALLAWSTMGGLDYDVFAQRMASTGGIFTGWPGSGAIVSSATGAQENPEGVTDNAAGMFVMWEDSRGFFPVIYAGHVLANGVVPALASLVEAAAEPDRVRLSWYSPDGAAFVADLQRADGDAEFATIATVRADGLGHVTYEDRDVLPGHDYRYRLAIAEAGGMRYLGAVTLRVPDALRLAVAGFRPNPAAGVPSIAFSLPGRESARIEVFDIAGRRVLEREIAGAAPGERVMPLGGARLDGGVYLLRVTQGARSVSARGVVLR